jgi:hypothetical protein
MNRQMSLIEFRAPGHRANDHDTSIAADKAIGRKASALHGRVIEAFRARNMTDKELERLPEFAEYGFSTIRKRRSELYQMGRIKETGTTREGCKEWMSVD